MQELNMVEVDLVGGGASRAENAMDAVYNTAAGAFVGGCVGFLIGGPVGAVGGAISGGGHAFMIFYATM